MTFTSRRNKHDAGQLPIESKLGADNRTGKTQVLTKMLMMVSIDDP